MIGVDQDNFLKGMVYGMKSVCTFDRLSIQIKKKRQQNEFEL